MAGADANPGRKENGTNFPPLEERMVELTFDNGNKKKVQALNKNFDPNYKYTTFYLPSVESLTEEASSQLRDWEEQMTILRDDLKWLLRLPHYKFWSILVFSEAISDVVLTSYLLRAPRPHDPQAKNFLNHSRTQPLLLDIHDLVFRVFLRLSTFKESKEDHISPSKWASLIYEHYFFDIPKLMELSSLYENSKKALLSKMVENIFKHEPRLLQGFNVVIPMYIEKCTSQTKTLKTVVKESKITGWWDVLLFNDLLRFNVDAAVSLQKFIIVYPPVAQIAHTTPELGVLEQALALTYDDDAQSWREVLRKLPQLESLVNLWRVKMLNLFRLILATPTILTNGKPTENGVDEFFFVLSNCLELNIFIHDYERTFPFRTDIRNLQSAGLHVDSTRIEYLGNALEASFHACGERYSQKEAESMLNDQPFDRQLLGACSLDDAQPDMQSLIAVVKDLLPDLSDQYVTACLKHFGFRAEAVIDAILEGSVPSELNEFDDVSPMPLVESNSDREGVYTNGSRRDAIVEELPSAQLKQRILNYAYESPKWTNVCQENASSYLQESLLPNFREADEYDDEYDDTYDELGVGMTEPDAQPLNIKAPRLVVEEAEEEEEEEQKGFEKFVEDPAAVRTRMERRWTEKNAARGKGTRDVTGRAKGQGQSADVVLNRRRKDESGSHNRRKRADFKRKEF